MLISLFWELFYGALGSFVLSHHPLIFSELIIKSPVLNSYITLALKNKSSHHFVNFVKLLSKA